MRGVGASREAGENVRASSLTSVIVYTNLRGGGKGWRSMRWVSARPNVDIYVPEHRPMLGQSKPGDRRRLVINLCVTMVLLVQKALGAITTDQVITLAVIKTITR